MKGIVTIVLALVMTFAVANTASAQCCQPVRHAAKRIACVPVNMVRKVQERQPVRSAIRKIDECRPVRKALKRCFGCCCCCGCGCK